MGVLGQSADTPDPEEQKDDAEQVVADVEKGRALEEDTETTRLNAPVPTPLYEQFREKCRREGVSMSEMVRRFVRAYVSD